MLAEMTPVPGSSLPVERLAEHLRLSRGFTNDGDLDAQLESCLRASLAAIEARTGKAVLRRRFVQTVTLWATSERHVLPIAPVASIEVVRMIDRLGEARVLEPAAYALVTDMHCPGLVPKSVSLPTLGSGRSAEIEFHRRLFSDVGWRARGSWAGGSDAGRDVLRAGRGRDRGVLAGRDGLDRALPDPAAARNGRMSRPVLFAAAGSGSTRAGAGRGRRLHGDLGRPGVALGRGRAARSGTGGQCHGVAPEFQDHGPCRGTGCAVEADTCHALS